MRKALAFAISIIFISTVYFFGSGCANRIPPSGGPRDSFPPTLVRSTPPDSTVNFRAKRIDIEFDEFVELQDAQNNLLFTPLFERNPKVSTLRKTLTIEFTDSLASNTTYILNFGNAVRDVNEGNIYRNFVYSFSTGPVLDSLELKGKVVMANTGRIDSTLVVALYRDLKDSVIALRGPEYISRLDAAGNFHFKNLPGGQFAIYAFGDAQGRRYRADRPFAFANTPVESGASGNLTLYAYIPNPPANTQSQPTAINRAISDRRLQFTTNLVNGQQDLRNHLLLNFAVPLGNFDSTKIRLSTDSIYTPAPFTSRLDSIRKEIRIQSAWKEGTSYNLVLDRDFAEDTTGRKLLKTDTLHFMSKKLADYGKLVLRIKNIDTAQNPVLQFVQNDQVIMSVPVKSGVYANDLFQPGEYQLRILYDRNRNGLWDPGQFFGAKRQPELVRPIEQRINVKPNWDNDFERSL